MVCASGDQRGDPATGAPSEVIVPELLPSASDIQISWSPVREDEYAMRLPSGEYCGFTLRPTGVETLRKGPFTGAAGFAGSSVASHRFTSIRRSEYARRCPRADTLSVPVSRNPRLAIGPLPSAGMRKSDPRAPLGRSE